MPDTTLTAATKLFVDRAELAARIDRGVLRLFGRFGAFVRQRSRTSIRQRKKPSPAGSPPSSHVGTLRNLILFGIDAGAAGGPSVVVGPVLFRPTGDVPRTLEEGGVVARRLDPKRLPPGPKKLCRYPARPFMAPAFQAETTTGKLAPLLRDFIE